MSLRIEVFNPRSDSITNLVECYWHVTSTDFVGPLINIPDGRQEIVIDLLNKTITTDFGRMYPVFKHAEGNVDLLIIRFHPYGLTSLTKQTFSKSTYKNTGQITMQISECADQLYLSALANIFANDSVVNKIKCFEDKIKERTIGTASIEPIVRDLITKIHSTQGRQKLNSFYNHYMISDRQLQTHFKNCTGMTAKNYSKIVRLSSVRKAKSLHDRVSLTEISYEYGYSDQSHLIKDFKQISGLTPLGYLKRKSAIEFIYNSE